MRGKKFSRIISAMLCGCLIGSSIVPGMGASEVQAQETSDQEWEAVSSILDSYPGVYTKDTRLSNNWDTTYSPDGPLMGNGTLYAFLAGDRKEQNFYISHSNMWQDRASNNGQEYTTFGGITIKKDNKEEENIALKKAVTVNSAVDASSAGEMLVDGNKNTKWCGTTPVEGSDSTYWAMVDLGQEYDISRWVVTHPVAGGENLPEFNTRDFQLQYSVKENPDGAVDDDWVAADIVEGNTDDLTDRNLENPITARYVRLYVTKPTQNTNNAVRIYELELYQEPKNESDEMQEFRYEQDMKNAEVRTQSESGFDLKSWLSAKENIQVTEITNVTDGELPMEVGTWTANANTTAKVEENMMISTKTGISKPKDRPSGTGTWEGWNVNVSMSSQIIGDVEQTVENIDDKKNTSTFTLQPEQSVILVSAVEGGKQEGQENSLEDAIEKSVSKLNTRLTTDELNASNELHREYWKQYWLKSYIDIADEKVERLYYGTLYQLGCATSTSSESNGGIPTGLYPWTAVEHPGWQGDYTTNTDFQRQIHPLVQANRTEGIQNYVNIIEQYWPEAQRRSASVDNLNWIIGGTGRPQFDEGIPEGALFPTHIGPWGASTEQYDDWRDYWNSPADATSVLMPVVKMWKYTRDDQFLKTSLYPMMKAVSTFWEQYVTFEDGKYVVYGATHEGNPGRNPIFDIDACKYMLENTIEAANILGVDSEGIEKWQDIVDHMSPVPTFIIDGKECIKEHEGRTPENPGYTFDGNPVTIQSVYYYDSIGMSASEEEKEKYYNYLARGNGMASPRRLNSAVRLGYDVNEIMDQMKKASIDAGPDYYGENGMRGNNTVGGVGMANILGMIQDSLLQSNEGFINIFANWYDNQETSFTRMGAENGFLVNAGMDAGGQVTYAKIHSEQGQECSVLNPWGDQELKVYENGVEIKADKEQNALGTVFTFATIAGTDYELKPAGGLETYLKLDPSVLKLQTGELQQLKVNTNVENPEIEWASSDMETAIAGIDGSVYGLKAGSAVITATLKGTELKAECNVTVENNAGINVAVKGQAAANSHHDNFVAQRAISGTWDQNYEGWVSRNESFDTVNSRWLMIDLQQEYTIDRWLIKHDGHRTNNVENNRGDYYLQVSPDGENGWETIDSKIDNKDNTTDQQLKEPVTGRYFRIYMEFPMFKSDVTGNELFGFARLNQVELYEVTEDENVINVEEIESINGIEAKEGTAFESLELPENVKVRLNNDIWFMTGVNWAKEEYHPDEPGIQPVTGTLSLPSAITNTADLKAQIQITVNEDVPKGTLEELLNRAKQHVENGEVDGLVESIQKLFAEAIEEGETVMAKEDASKKEVLDACLKLMKAIQALEFKAGDKADLGMALELTGMIDLTMYVEAGQAEYLAAKAVAEGVMADGDAMQQEVDEAWTALVNAMMNLRLKADKSTLEDLLESVKTIDLTLYTEESVAVFSQALEKAEAVMADVSLTADDQAKVDESVENLRAAKDQLVLKNPSGGSDNNGDDPNAGNNGNGGTGDKGSTTVKPEQPKGQNVSKTTSIKTGDTDSVMIPIVCIIISLGLAAAAGAVMIKKRQRK